MDFLHAWIVPPSATVGSWEYIATAFAALMIMAVSKDGFGGGVGILSVPMMFYVAQPEFVLGIWVPLLVVCDIATIQQYPKEWNPRAFARLAPGVLAGIVLVTLVVRSLNAQQDPTMKDKLEHALKLGCGIISIAFVLLQVRPKGPESEQPWRPTWAVSLPVGLLTGITTMIANAAGPIVNMFLLPQKLDKRVFVGTCGRFYFIFNTIKIPFVIACGWATWETFHYGVWMMILGPVGVVLGRWLNNHLSPVWFERLVRVSLVVAGVKLISDAVQK